MQRDRIQWEGSPGKRIQWEGNPVKRIQWEGTLENVSNGKETLGNMSEGKEDLWNVWEGNPASSAAILVSAALSLLVSSLTVSSRLDTVASISLQRSRSQLDERLQQMHSLKRAKKGQKTQGVMP